MNLWSKRNRRRQFRQSPWQMVLERLEERTLLAATITPPAAQTTLEDATKAITGLSIASTVDPVSMTLSVSHGTITLNTSVTNGLTAAQITGNSSSSVTISGATTVAVNATFANATGLSYSPSANFNGSDTMNLHLLDNVGSIDDKFSAISVTQVNDAPSFSFAGNPNQLAAAIPLMRTVSGFATNLQPGPATATDEVGQALNFIVTTNNDALFAVLPTIDAAGTLTYKPAFLPANTSGTATVSVKLHDSGLTANGGIDTSAAQTFTISTSGLINPVYNAVGGAKLRAFVVNGVMVVQANGIPFLSYPSAAIQSLTFNCGSKNDEIDLSGVTAALFPILNLVKINSGAGNDRIVGSYANDSIDGGSGNDTLTGGLGDDTLIGNAGTDLLVEAATADLMLNDTSLTGLGSDKLVTIENASLTADDLGRTIDAHDFDRGAVTLTGGAGNDILTGGSKNDAITGRDGDDVLAGGDGNDTIVGGFGNDSLLGGLGNDVLIGGFGDDTIDGGDGRDTVVGGNGGAARGGNGGADAGDDLMANAANEINEAFKKLFAWE